MLGNDIGYRTLAHGPLLSRAGLFGFACVVMCQASDILNYFFLPLALPVGAEFEGCAGAENIAVFGWSPSRPTRIMLGAALPSTERENFKAVAVGEAIKLKPSTPSSVLKSKRIADRSPL